ncbi:F-box only protein 40 [Pelobates fuscus]|uniref:F-box only protein 40 n=1 Tax=Pelobates fuscus TaxID=191477 RepID=UPI002FE4C00B
MGRPQKPPPGQHKHCDLCFNKRCQAPVNVGVSCSMIACRTHCGATFHLCKEDEHRLLCPLEWVPCLNSVFGCPFSMSRSKLTKHLKVCPASVVCCSMDWNRWPVIDKEGPLFENLTKEEQNEECLDVALALRDQNILFSSLKMSEFYPELSENPQNIISLEKDDDTMEEVGAVGGTDLQLNDIELNNGEVGLTQYEREALARNKGGDLDASIFSDWESIFSKEKTAAQYLESNAAQSNSNTSKTSKNTTAKSKMVDKQEETKTQDEKKKQNVNMETTGLAPWQDGVLERLKTEVDCGSYNMYLVHHGSMLIQFGQMAACTPKEKDFVYGKLEAQVVKSVNTFKIPDSYHWRRARPGEDRPKVVKEQSVDTSDLGIQQQDLPLSDAIYNTLLCALEKEVRGHTISETNALACMLTDIGTQTFDFGMDAFSDKIVLLDTLPHSRNVGLHLDIETECVTRRNNTNNSAFSFSCNLFFRRDEFSFHFKNAHCDIQSDLNGWFHQRCPLSYLGCTFAQNRFHPKKQKAQVIYNKELKTFGMKPLVADTLYEGVRPNLSRSNRGKSKDSLTTLPLEVLQHIAGFLDSFSLSQLSQVSVLTRDVCATLLHERGMVHLCWEKKTYSHGGTSWRSRKKVWNFSSLFSKVHHWEFDDAPSMAEHLKICPFNSREAKKERFKLPSLYQTGQPEQKKETLLSLRKTL